MFGKVGDVSCQFRPEIPKIVSCWALKSFIFWEHCLIFFEENKRVDHSSVDSIEKNRFPPSHAFPVHGMGSQDLIGSIYGIHELVVIVEDLRLFNSSIWVPHTSNFCLTGSLYLVICFGECTYYRHYFVV